MKLAIYARHVLFLVSFISRWILLWSFRSSEI